VETTLISAAVTFEQACKEGNGQAQKAQRIQAETNDPSAYRFWPLATLRTERGITPME